MLQTLGLVKQFKKFRAVDGLDLEVRPGEIVGLLGPNGAGKTTALRCMAGILKPNDGRILINGVDLGSDQARAKASLAYVPEVPSLYELLSVDEHIKFVAMCFNTMDEFDARRNALLERYDLLEKRRDLVATLSKGMKQKLAVACALIHNANVLLLDEPLVGIDPAGQHELKQELLRARSSGASLLISTHLLDTAEKLCDRVVILNRGRKVAEGALDDLRAMMHGENQSLEELFLKLTQETDASPHLPGD